MRHLHIDCFVGISGDMALAALIDLGVDAEALADALSGLGHSIRIESRRTVKSGIAGTAVVVGVGHDHGHEPRPHGMHDPQHGHSPNDGEGHEHPHGQASGLSYNECCEAIWGARLSKLATERSLAVLRCIGEAEAAVHGTDLDAVHFHELGGVDTLIDVCGTAVALETLGVETLSAGPIPLAHGWIDCAHGTLPVPPPAVAKLAEGIPTVSVDISGETVTPTGAAIIRGLATEIGSMPPMRVHRVGYGAGNRDFDPYPNLLRVYLGEIDAQSSLPRVTEICTQVDDCSPEILAHAARRLMDAGALDVYLAPVTMKKGRPGTSVTVLAAPGEAQALAQALMIETSTIGVRFRECSRLCLPRGASTITTSYGAVQLKWVQLPNGTRRATPEYEDCLRVAESAHVPLREVYEAAMAAWRRQV